MVLVRLSIAIHVALAAVSLCAAQPVGPVLPGAGVQPVAPLEEDLPSPYSDLPVMDTPAQDPSLPLIEGYEPVGTPNWASSPYRRTGWRFGLMPDIPEDDDEFTIRANLGYEHKDGTGKRAVFWMYNDEAGSGFNSAELWASSFYFDWYKRHYYHQAELLLGGGLALNYQSFEIGNTLANRFYGGGGSLVAEGFLPFVDGKRSDFGAVARGRVGAFIGGWDAEFDDDDFDDWIMLAEEFAWGLEYRQLFGKNDSHFWYLSLMREIHNFGGGDWPYSSELIIEGTALNFGITW